MRIARGAGELNARTSEAVPLVSIASKLEASKTRSKADASHEYETRSAGDRDARIGEALNCPPRVLKRDEISRYRDEKSRDARGFR